MARGFELSLDPPGPYQVTAYFSYLTGVVGTLIWGYGDVLSRWFCHLLGQLNPATQMRVLPLSTIPERPVSQTMRFHLTSLLSDEPDGLRGRIFGIYLRSICL